MNWRHLQAFVWLRWRLAVNQWRRTGTFNLWLMMIVAVGAAALAGPLFLASTAVGVFLIPKAEPLHLLYAGDVLAAVFVFLAAISLMTEMQRTESLSLGKFLHLPVSLKGAFLINYASSLLNLNMIGFVPVMLGFCLALAAVKGPLLLAAFPLLAAFLLMITAAAYQFQGWLASLMNNPRRRRTVTVAATIVFILIFQIPYLLNFLRPWAAEPRHDPQAQRMAELTQQSNELSRRLHAGEITPGEFQRRHQELLQSFDEAREQAQQAEAEYWKQAVKLANVVLPPGWFPLGISGAAQGDLRPALLGFLGMTSIGGLCLWRAYRTTLGLYQGRFTAQGGRRAPGGVQPQAASKPGRLLLEARLSWVSEPVAAVALGGLRSLLRSSEGKMMLLTPVMMSFIFLAAVWKVLPETPLLARPLIAVGAMFVVLFGVIQITGNQFGYDRGGFRVFVLCAASRRDILLGKNLAFAPIVFGMAAVMLVAVQIVCPLRPDHLLAVVPQYVSMYLLTCLVMNLLSIYAPMPIAAGSMKPSNPKLVPMLLQMAAMAVAFPLIQTPTLLPLGIEFVLHTFDVGAGLPIYLVLSLALCAGVIFVYRRAIAKQGELLQANEQRILETVTDVAP